MIQTKFSLIWSEMTLLTQSSWWSFSSHMESGGKCHTVLLRSDGHAVAFGGNGKKQCNIPTCRAGLTYKQVSTGHGHTVLLRSDGHAVAFGHNGKGQCNIPDLDAGFSYTQVSAGGLHTVLLRSDGHAAACGANDNGRSNIPLCGARLVYTQVSAGGLHTVLLRSDGLAVARGMNHKRQLDIPPLPKREGEGLSYSQVSAGRCHTVLLRSDGTVVACGMNDHGQCNIPDLDDGFSYTQVSAGGMHTVLLRSDGHAVAFGHNGKGQCNIPDLDAGFSYTQVSAGGLHTLLLRSDGHAVACGMNDDKQCRVPALHHPANSYVADLLSFPLLQMCFSCEDHAMSVLCRKLSGDEMLRLNAHWSDLAWDLYKRIASELRVNLQNLNVVLPDQQLLAKVCQARPEATIADLAGEKNTETIPSGGQHAKRRRHHPWREISSVGRQKRQQTTHTMFVLLVKSKQGNFGTWFWHGDFLQLLR